MIREKEQFLVRLMKFADFMVIFISFFLSYLITSRIRQYLGLIFWDFGSFIETYSLLCVLAPVIWITSMSYYGVYTDFRTKPFSEILWSILWTGIMTFLFIGSATFILTMHLTSISYNAI